MDVAEISAIEKISVRRMYEDLEVLDRQTPAVSSVERYRRQNPDSGRLN